MDKNISVVDEVHTVKGLLCQLSKPKSHIYLNGNLKNNGQGLLKVTILDQLNCQEVILAADGRLEMDATWKRCVHCAMCAFVALGFVATKISFYERIHLQGLSLQSNPYKRSPSCRLTEGL